MKNWYPPISKNKLPKISRKTVGLDNPASGKADVVPPFATIGVGDGDAAEVEITWADAAEKEVKNK